MKRPSKRPSVPLPDLPDTVRRWVQEKAETEGRDPLEIVIETLERQAREDLAVREAGKKWTRRNA